MNELTEEEKQILAMMQAVEEEQLKNPPSEPVQPMAAWKTEDPIGLVNEEEEEEEVNDFSPKLSDESTNELTDEHNE